MTETFLRHIGAQDILDKPEAAYFLRIQKRTLDDWMRKGIVPFSKLPSGAVRFRRDHLLDFVGNYATKQTRP